jgi:hypothetical protein
VGERASGAPCPVILRPPRISARPRPAPS